MKELKVIGHIKLIIPKFELFFFVATSGSRFYLWKGKYRVGFPPSILVYDIHIHPHTTGSPFTRQNACSHRWTIAS